jgi:hypothetical protein
MLRKLLVLCAVLGVPMLVDFGSELPGVALSAAESSQVCGADCGYVESGGGTDWGCCGWCWTGSEGWGTFPEYRSTPRCLNWVSNVHCPCCNNFCCLGSVSCVY